MKRLTIDERCEAAKRTIDKAQAVRGPTWDRSDAVKFPIAGKMARRIINGDR